MEYNFQYIINDLSTSSNDIDKIGYNLFLYCEKYIKDNINSFETMEDFSEFHKHLRQIDITNNGYLDLCLYNYMNESDYFWMIVKDLIESKNLQNK
jgi:hypothetical protein